MTLTMEEKLKMWKAARGERCSSSTLGHGQLQGNGKENEPSSCISGLAEGYVHISVKCPEFVSEKRQLEPISPSDANAARERGSSGLSIRKKRPKSSFVNSAVATRGEESTEAKTRRSLHSSTGNVGFISSLSHQNFEKRIKVNDDLGCTASIGYDAHKTPSPLRLASPLRSRDCLQGKRSQICQSEAPVNVNEVPSQSPKNTVQTPRSFVTAGPSLSNKSGFTVEYSDMSIQTTPIIERTPGVAAHQRKEAAVQTTSLEDELTNKEVISARREAEAMIFQAEVAEQRAHETELRLKELEVTKISDEEAENLNKLHKEQMQDLRWTHMSEVDTLEKTIEEADKMIQQLKEGLEQAISKNSLLQDKLDQINSATSSVNSNAQ